MNQRLYILVFILISSKWMSAQTVDFTITTSNNLFCAPQAVTFTQTCTGSPDGFIWEFGNGQVSSNPSPTITYLLPGTYTVTLTATFANAALSATKTVVINPTPTVTISANRNYICQPGTISFTAGTDPNITSYQWNFGDGTTATTATNTTTHNFTTYNSFNVSVVGVSAAGCPSAAATTTVVVKKFDINASVSPNDGCIPALSTFTATTTLPVGDVANNFVWTFGDGSPNATTATGNTTHTYSVVTPITTASVYITTAEGCTNQYSFPAFAFGTPPTGTVATTVTNRTTFCGSETIAFNATATNATNYRWSFGDGTIKDVTTNQTDHKYRTLGNMQVIVVPYFNGCAGEPDTINIVVTGVIANYTFGNTCSNKNTFNYTNTSLGTVNSFAWTFSDNPAIPDVTNYNTSHSFPTSGAFTTKLWIFNAATGCTDSLITNQYTATPNFSLSTNKVCKDSFITYTVLNSYPAAAAYTYKFHVAGEIRSTALSVVNLSATTHGTFNDFVVIENPAGNTCNDTLRSPIPTVVAGPIAQFSTSAGQCIDNSFTFSNTSSSYIPSETITNYNWHFGDSTFSTASNPPPKRYSQVGTYNISLVVTDVNNCKQTANQTVNVYPLPRLRTLPAIDTLCLGQSVQMLAFTTDTLLWLTTTNLACATCDTTLATPQFTTSYIAQAKNSFGCISRDTSLIKVYRPFVATVTPSDTTVCPGQVVNFLAGPMGIFNWQPSALLNSPNAPNPYAIVNDTTNFTVIVADSVGCFSDTVTAIVKTFPPVSVNAGPDLNVPYNANFTINATYSNNVSTYAWSPIANNLSCTNCPTPSGVAQLTQLYNIKVTSINGCKAEDSVLVSVACDKANLYIPTVFTPNGDGRNDVFYPMARGYKVINNFVVYNRWGQVIFQRKNFAPNNATFGWNGIQPGSNLQRDIDTYVWYIEATCDQGQLIKSKGTVVLAL